MSVESQACSNWSLVALAALRLFQFLCTNCHSAKFTCLCIVIQHPIVEGGPPSSLDAFVPIVESVLSLLSSGASVLCHCRGGVGRAGLLASCVLIAAGISTSPGDAIALVRKRRHVSFVLSQVLPSHRNEGVQLLLKRGFKKTL